MDKNSEESIWDLLLSGDVDVIEHQFYGAYQIDWFFKKVFGDESDGQIILRAANEQTEWICDTDLIISIALNCARLAKLKGIFFRMTMLCYEDPYDNDNRPKGITSVPALWVNIKIQDPRSITGQLPSLAEAIEFLKSQSMKPDIIVDVGTELQAYWILDKPFIVDSPDARDEITELLHRFQQKIIAGGLQRGWLIEDTSDIDRFQRVPGTWNLENDPPTPIKILEPENNDGIFIGKCEEICKHAGNAVA